MTRPQAIIDARGRTLPPLPGAWPLPRLLTDAAPAPTAPRRGAGPWGRGPTAAMPVVAPGTRTESRTIHVYNAVDVSASNDTTDPYGARFRDLAFVAREWAAAVVPDDVFIPVLFDDRAAVYQGRRPADVPKRAWRNTPGPGHGGTAFVPPVHAVIDDARRSPDCAHLLIMYSDGLGSDIADAHRLLLAASIPAVLIPYGPDFPWIAAQWEHTAFRIAAHVDDRRRAIAQTVALAILTATGHRRTA